MKIVQVYKYKKDEIVYVGGEVPDGAEIIETMDILNADKGYNLVRISDKENVGSSIWLKNGDSMDNYEEIEREDRMPKREVEDADNE